VVASKVPSIFSGERKKQIPHEKRREGGVNVTSLSITTNVTDNTSRKGEIGKGGLSDPTNSGTYEGGLKKDAPARKGRRKGYKSAQRRIRNPFRGLKSFILGPTHS